MGKTLNLAPPAVRPIHQSPIARQAAVQDQLVHKGRRVLKAIQVLKARKVILVSKDQQEQLDRRASLAPKAIWALRVRQVVA